MNNILILKTADVFFWVLHLGIILFNMTGWIWKKTIRIHLAVIGITGLSWFFLGIWFGLGYCPITDWHWQIKEKLGETDLPSSFITYFFETLHLQVIPKYVNIITMVVFILAFCISVYRNIITGLIKRKQKA